MSTHTHRGIEQRTVVSRDAKWQRQQTAKRKLNNMIMESHFELIGAHEILRLCTMQRHWQTQTIRANQTRL